MFDAVVIGFRAGAVMTEDVVVVVGMLATTVDGVDKTTEGFGVMTLDGDRITTC